MKYTAPPRWRCLAPGPPGLSNRQPAAHARRRPPSAHVLSPRSSSSVRQRTVRRPPAYRPPPAVRRPPSAVRLPVRRPPSASRYPPSAVRRPPPAVSPPTAHRPPSAARRPPPTAHRLPPTVRRPPPAAHRPPSAICRPPALPPIGATGNVSSGKLRQDSLALFLSLWAISPVHSPKTPVSPTIFPIKIDSFPGRYFIQAL